MGAGNTTSHRKAPARHATGAHNLDMIGPHLHHAVRVATLWCLQQRLQRDEMAAVDASVPAQVVMACEEEPECRRGQQRRLDGLPVPGRMRGPHRALAHLVVRRCNDPLAGRLGRCQLRLQPGQLPAAEDR